MVVLENRRKKYYENQELRLSSQLKNRNLTPEQRRSMENELSSVQRAQGKQPTGRDIQITPEQKYVVTDYQKQQSYVVGESELRTMQKKQEQQKQFQPTGSNQAQNYEAEKQERMIKAEREVWPVSTWLEENVISKIPSKNIPGQVLRDVARIPKGAIATVEPVFTSPKWAPKLAENYKDISKRFGPKYARDVTVLGTVKTYSEPIYKNPVDFFITGLAF
jgi:hypothetical protein